ncbi:hypothetical protein DPMN_059203 [Dreissena polymorpha]|uniref:Uncharacterized protein n=1 Tax=Dreissena polymorpha TaxID=45954 RepID=A0A9D4HEQ6_DREPO|nr:hypothetical protein DPMN_059203 [Dreissena polymorpha]
MCNRYPDFHMSLTMNRKRMTEVARGADADNGGDMADFMKHKKSTADRHYAVHHQL